MSKHFIQPHALLHSSLYSNLNKSPSPPLLLQSLCPFLSTGCLSWHCRVEPKAGDRIPGMKYDTLMPEDIELYLNGRSWEDLKAGDEIAFPEPDGSAITPESLVGRRITLTQKNIEYEGTIESFASGTGEHKIAFDDGDSWSDNLKTGGNSFMIEGAEAYFDIVDIVDVRGVCIIREFQNIITH